MFNSHWHSCSTVTSTIIQQLLARLFNSHWHYRSAVTDTTVQPSLARLFNSHWHHCSTVCRHNCSTVAGAVVQQSLEQLFNSHWHGSSTVTSTILQQSLAAFFLCWQNSPAVMFAVEESCHVPEIRHKIWLSTSV